MKVNSKRIKEPERNNRQGAKEYIELGVVFIGFVLSKVYVCNMLIHIFICSGHSMVL